MFYKTGLSHALTYPITKEQFDKNIEYKIHSPTFEDDPRIDMETFNKVPEPFVESDFQFWGELSEVALKVDLARKRVKTAKIDQDPELKKRLLNHKLDSDKPFLSRTYRDQLRIDNFLQAAHSVKADWPTEILIKLTQQLLKEGATFKNYLKRDFKCTEFTDGLVFFAEVLPRAIRTVSPTAFYTKWYYGKQRPQEAAGRWARGESECPKELDHILCSIIDKQAVQKDEKLFPNYIAPLHCSYVAMHGAAAGASILFPTLMNLNEDQLDEVRRTAFNIATFRDFGGVHYNSDSMAGLDIGEHVLENKLYSLLESMAQDAGRGLEISESEFKQSVNANKMHWLF